jgi:hypothetical protein
VRLIGAGAYHVLAATGDKQLYMYGRKSGKH